MQPRPDPLDPVRALAWRITCDNELLVTIVVADHHVLLHSVDDGFVPATASSALTAARPDIVTYEEFTIARHTKLWNFDRTRWEDAIRAWLDQLGSQRA